MVNKILIVGGSGSVGTHLIRNIKNDFMIYSMDKIKKETHRGVKYYICNLTDTQTLEKIKKRLPDGLVTVLLAGNLVKSHENKEFLDGINNNIVGLSNFVLTLSPKISHLIYISSVSVYGIPKYNPIDEKHPLNPFSAYGIQKSCAELILKFLCKELKIPLTIVRTTQLFGIQSAKLTLPHILVDSLKKNSDVKLLVEPNCERDYLHISDFSQFLRKVIQNPIEGVFNVGSGCGIKLYKLFQMAFETYGIPFNLNDVLKNDYDYSFSQVLDISHAHKIYDFKPQYSVKEWFLDVVNDNSNNL